MTDQTSKVPSFNDLLTQRLTRREMLSAGVALAPLAALPSLLTPSDAAAGALSTLNFKPVVGSKADAIVLPPGYTYDIVARWGDSLFDAVPSLDSSKLAAGCLFDPKAAEYQRGQFGQNCDAIHFFPLDRRGTHGVLCVNNEYTDDALMFVGHPGFEGAAKGDGRAYVRANPQITAVAQAAQGVSVIEIVYRDSRWQMVKNSRFNRRITANTQIEIGGPARGSELLQTRADPTGTQVFGTFGNCAGGETPWGTYLTCEENIQDYFGNAAAMKASTAIDPFVVDAHKRLRM